MQPNPLKNNNPEVYALFTKDLEERYRMGLERYGVALQPFNGRDALVDAYEEAIDLAFYLRQAIYERDNLKKDLFCEHDWCFDCESADGKLGYFYCSKCGMEKIVENHP